MYMYVWPSSHLRTFADTQPRLLYIKSLTITQGQLVDGVCVCVCVTVAKRAEG